MSRKATEGIDYTTRDYQAFREMMVENLSTKLPEYDTSQTDAGIVILEGTAKACDILSMYNDIVANDTLLDTTQDRNIAVTISKMLGHVPANATASKLKQIFVLSKILDEDKVISRGTIVHTKQTQDEDSIYFETIEDMTIPAGCLGDEKDDDGNYLYTVTVSQGRSVSEDVLGTSDGITQNQTFNCSYQNVIIDSLEVYVNEGDGYVLWERVDTFINSSSDSRHYTVSVDEFDRCTITFGNGTLGRIPMFYDGGIIADYRVGGGKIGNVKENTITEVESGISFLDYTTNIDVPFELGAEKEPLNEIKELAPKAFKTQERAVANGDFADMVRLAFNKYIRFTRDVSEAGNLTVKTYYLMRDGYEMTEDLKNEILNYMSPHKVVGAVMELHDHVDKVVNIQSQLKVDKDYNQAQTKALVQSVVESYFAIGQFDFGEEFILTDLESEVMNSIEGVRSFRILTPSDDVAAEDYEILKLGTLDIEVSGGKL